MHDQQIVKNNFIDKNILMKFMKYLLLVMIMFIWSCQMITFAGGDFWFGMKHDNIKAREEIKIWWVDENQEEKIIDLVKNFVNRTLGILALVALIFVLYGGLSMVIAAGDEEKYKKWWTILKTASLWLIFIGLAWFILSLIFWWIVTFSKDAWSANSLK